MNYNMLLRQNELFTRFTWKSSFLSILRVSNANDKIEPEWTSLNDCSSPIICFDNVSEDKDNLSRAEWETNEELCDI